jgi:hypothetical protein
MVPGAMLRTGAMLFLCCTKKAIASSEFKIPLRRYPTISTERAGSLPQEAPTLLVGHAYGCAVITGAGHTPNVVGLVYLAGPALDEGESLRSLWARRAPPEGAANIYQDKYGFLWIATDRFRETFCHDHDETEALVWALTQKPTAARCFEDKSGAPAWKV